MTKTMTIDAYAFDIDGTLYPPLALYARLVPFTAFNLPLMFAFEKTRGILHKAGALPSGVDFYERQAKLLGGFLGVSEEKARDIIEKKIYTGWVNHFKHIKPYPHVAEVVAELKKRGKKLAILSDFPIREKLLYMNLENDSDGKSFWDAELCSEECGALKPARASFDCLAEALGVEAERILYIGNSYRYDIVGAGIAGMKTALRVDGANPRKKWASIKPDIVFTDYRELLRIEG